MQRREFIAMSSSAALFAAHATSAEEKTMYGLIGKMIATPGQRDALIGILLEGTAKMPGCLSYVIARDPQDADAIWITEVWDNEQSHRESLSIPAVRQSITRAKPLITSFSSSPTEPVGGVGLAVQ